jgi:uncharacterized protein (DUF2062 family)
MRSLFRSFHTRIVAPFRTADIPPAQVSRGAGFGMFIALLPIVGQLYLTPVVWGVLRPFAWLRFNLPVAMGMALIVNPPIKVPLFYGYLVTGEALLALAGIAPGHSSTQFLAAEDVLAQGPWLERFWAVERLLALAVEHYALPLALGGTAWALTVGGLVGIGTHWTLMRRRRLGAIETTPAA